MRLNVVSCGKGYGFKRRENIRVSKEKHGRVLGFYVRLTYDIDVDIYDDFETGL